MYALNLDTENRILSVCECIEGMEYDIVVESFPDDNVRDYKYIDGEFIHDPLPKPEPPEPPKPDPDPTGSVTYATYDELAAAIQEGVNSYGK